jgi:hypothetical protein
MRALDVNFTVWGHVKHNDVRHMGVELRGISGGELSSSDYRLKGVW